MRSADSAKARLPRSTPVDLWLVPLRDKGEAQAALRRLLGERLGAAPGELRFERGEWGKPRLAGAELAFSLSHSGDLALIGIAETGVLGVDVERPRPRSVERLAERVLTDAERRVLEGAAGAAERVDWFYRCWTAKEAVAKAFGTGLTLAPWRIEVVAEDAERASVRVAPSERGPLPEGAEPVEVRWLPAGEGFVAALAASGAWDERRAPRRLTD